MNSTKLVHLHPGLRLLPGIALFAIAVLTLLDGHYVGTLPFLLSFFLWWALQYFMLFKCGTCGSRMTMAACPCATTVDQLTKPRAGMVICLKCNTVDFPAQATPAKST
ncbi:MAG TPA: hypothetical protein DEF00_04435 [Candidatus Taylorbacteria bacterium]|nr:MAG: hypothetical protein UY03_C0010G0018 [Parcubacteria group bacterium GW2011_GWA2_47_64]KKU97148.1 MAG: hypothetical protein UY29_C0002G0045 [Parcubacteria group bacterium GW2011_GWC2_48_17]HBV01600.1 hypothetical protein [Candidatus Taylorbacteria bacterium]